MNQFYKNLALWLVISLIMILLFNLFNRPKPAQDKLNYSDFVTAVDAVHGRVKCPSCGQVVLHQGAPDEVLRCTHCGWQTTWLTYFRSLQHKQLSGADAVLALFREFMARFPSAQSRREKMLLIDALIHGFH